MFEAIASDGSLFGTLDRYRCFWPGSPPEYTFCSGSHHHHIITSMRVLHQLYLDHPGKPFLPIDSLGGTTMGAVEFLWTRSLAELVWPHLTSVRLIVAQDHLQFSIAIQNRHAVRTLPYVETRRERRRWRRPGSVPLLGTITGSQFFSRTGADPTFLLNFVLLVLVAVFIAVLALLASPASALFRDKTQDKSAAGSSGGAPKLDLKSLDKLINEVATAKADISLISCSSGGSTDAPAADDDMGYRRLLARQGGKRGGKSSGGKSSGGSSGSPDKVTKMTGDPLAGKLVQLQNDFKVIKDKIAELKGSCGGGAAPAPSPEDY